jgi:hypothetical protein
MNKIFLFDIVAIPRRRRPTEHGSGTNKAGQGDPGHDKRLLGRTDYDNRQEDGGKWGKQLGKVSEGRTVVNV